MTAVTTVETCHTAMAEIEKYHQRGFGNLSNKEDWQPSALTEYVRLYEADHLSMPVQQDLTTLLEDYIKENGLTHQKLAAFL